MDEIKVLINEVENLTGRLKTAKKMLKDQIEETETYKAIYDYTLSSDVKVSEKDAAKHAFNVTVKNLKGPVDDD